MRTTEAYIVIGVAVILLIVLFAMVYGKQKTSNKRVSVHVVKQKNDNLGVVSYKLILPLRIQACERLLLYLERIQFSVLVKRIYQHGISRDDFQFSLMQNVQDELEHNMAQRLYVTEKTWQLVNLAKEEVLKNINTVFNDNKNADVTAIAQKLVSFENPMVENAVKSIKNEFSAF